MKFAAVSFPLALAVASLAGCNHRAHYVDPDEMSKVEGTGIESRDIRAVVALMSGEIQAAPVIQQFQGNPRLAVMPVENRSRFLIDQDIFTTLIQDELVRNTGGGKLQIVNRDLVNEILKEREMKRSGQVDTTGSQKALAGVEYFLEGEIQSLTASSSRAQSDYVVIRFQLTDAESAVVVWSNTYEMKKEGSWGVMYQ